MRVSEIILNDNNSNEILTKRKPLIYTKARRAEQENKKIALKLGKHKIKKKKKKLGDNNNHKLIKGH